MTTIAVDAMGGDHAPRAEVEGAILAARELGVRVLLVGIEATVRHELNRHKIGDLPIEIVPATDVVTMTDSPSHAFRRKKDSSLHVAARLVRDGKADALVSAGNTGAGPPGPRMGFPQHQRESLGNARRRCQRGFQAPAYRTVRRNGRDLLPRA